MEIWLTKNKFLCGPEKTLADISACHELDQTKFLNYDLSKWPKVQAWLKAMIDDDPVMLKVAEPMRKLAAASRAKM
jgi:glutathione S-transferase